MMSTIFLHSTHLKGPKLFGHITHISIKAGKAKPSADRQKAPTRDMNSPSKGTVAASITTTVFFGLKWRKLVIIVRGTYMLKGRMKS